MDGRLPDLPGDNEHNSSDNSPIQKINDVVSQTAKDTITNPASIQTNLAKNVISKGIEENETLGDFAENAQKTTDTVQKAQTAAPVVQGILGGLGSFFGGQTANLPTSAGLGGTGDGSGARGMKLDQQKKIANAIMSFLMTTQFKALGNKPMTQQQAAAFAGNWFQESSFDTSNSLNQQFNLNTTNQQIMAIGNPGPLQPVLGLGMWDYERRYKLAALAESKGMKWNDIGAQLLYFQTEFDGNFPYDGKHMIAEGFNDPTKSVGDLAYIINNVPIDPAPWLKARNIFG